MTGLPFCQNLIISYLMTVAEDKQEKKKDVGDCTRSCVGIIVAILVQHASKIFEQESPYSLLLDSPHFFSELHFP